MKISKKILSAALIIAILCGAAIGRPKSDAYLRSRTVKLTSAKGSCSGEQVRAPSGVDYILTAGHCRVLDNGGQITAETEDGKKLSRKIIAEDPDTDLLLLEGLPNMQGLDIAKENTRFDHIKTWTHGLGMATYRTEGEVIQEKRTRIPTSVITTPEEEAACSGMPKKQGDGFGSRPVSAESVFDRI